MQSTSEFRIELKRRRQRVKLNGVKVVAKDSAKFNRLIGKLRSMTGRNALYSSETINLFVNSARCEFAVIGDPNTNGERPTFRSSVDESVMTELMECVDSVTNGLFRSQLVPDRPPAMSELN